MWKGVSLGGGGGSGGKICNQERQVSDVRMRGLKKFKRCEENNQDA